MPPVESFLATHAHTLRVLVWEGREAARTTWTPDTSLNSGWLDDDHSDVRKILSKCVNLVELSLALQWHRIDRQEVSRTTRPST